MIGKAPPQNQMNLFRPMLHDFIDMEHELVILANRIDWGFYERSFARLYSRRGKPSMPIRFMTGALLLKKMYDLSYTSLAGQWVSNPYMQYFCGEACFRHKFPCDPSDFAHFKRRIGEKGLELIYSALPAAKKDIPENADA
jgi:IS5 family transposase